MDMSQDLSAKPRLIRNCRVSKTLEQGAMILMPEGVIRLTGTGVDIIDLCDGQRTLQELIAALKEKFTGVTSDQIEKEVLEFLGQLKQKRVVDF